MNLPETEWRANAEGSALFLSAASHWQLCLTAAASDWTAGGGGVQWRQPMLELSLMNPL